ncbi:MAG: DNA mismatch repair endonuclease MutL [Chloroflexi bacterium]|nr:DNA mismatch repair endonuclease MutL [Chloroflexota bacterium]
MPIKILPESVTNKIAAGEVVENPASVVKELLENAIDAGAQTISIRIAGGGKELIEISDDGSGIPAQEVALAVTRFATSKIDSIDDLQRIHSLGFRGEALASIGAVSHLRVQTRARDENEGSELVCDGGKVKKVLQKAFPQGSRLEVRELFANVPARLKFLKSDRTERSRIAELVTLYALAYLHIRFTLEVEGRISLQTSGNGNRREILASVYDLDSARQMLELDLAEADYHIVGFCSPVGITRSNRRDIHFFVNGRLIQDVGMTSALVNAYRSYLMVGRFPIAVVFLEVPPQEVDINIHPAKAEVRFADARAVTGRLVRAVRLALLASSPAPAFSSSLWANSNEQADAFQHSSHPLPTTTEPFSTPVPFQTTPPSSPQPDLGLTGQIPLLRVIGQVGATYIVAEGPDGLYLIDQHAAHERILYEQLLDKSRQTGDAQLLLEPILFTPNPKEGELFADLLASFNEMGFQVEPFGPTSYRIRAVPSFLARNFSLKIMQDALHEVGEEGRNAVTRQKEEILVRSICKGVAVKGGMTLSMQEQQGLVRQLEACQNPRTCPHGRPTMIHLSVDILEKQFGRKGSL